MRPLEHLFESNRRWAERMEREQPDFFRELARSQNPDYLWIGCSDSRVPSNSIIGLKAGELFVHRNIANVVSQTDLNLLSALQYAVDVLSVRHVILCGHYGCGGIKAALSREDHGLIGNWLWLVRNVYQKHRTALVAIENEEQRFNRLCELNMIEQLYHLCHTTVVQKCWEQERELTIHGWMYDLETGLLRDMGLDLTSQGETEESYLAMVTQQERRRSPR